MTDLSSVKRLIGANIKKYRKQRGYTQKQIADHFHVSLSTVSMWERGENSISADLFLMLCRHLNVSPDSVCGNVPSSVTFDEMRLIEKFRSLDDTQKEMILASIDAAYAATKKESASFSA